VAQHEQPAASEGVVEVADGGQQRGVIVGWQGTGQGPGQAGHVDGEQQLASGPVGPSPQGDVVEEAAQCEHGGVCDAGRHLLVAGDTAPPSAGAVDREEAFDVAAVELRQRGHLWVVVGEEDPEGDEVVGQPVN
jgi:hypothetical protein